MAHPETLPPLKIPAEGDQVHLRPGTGYCPSEASHVCDVCYGVQLGVVLKDGQAFSKVPGL